MINYSTQSNCFSSIILFLSYNIQGYNIHNDQSQIALRSIILKMVSSCLDNDRSQHGLFQIGSIPQRPYLIMSIPQMIVFKMVGFIIAFPKKLTLSIMALSSYQSFSIHLDMVNVVNDHFWNVIQNCYFEKSCYGKRPC